MKPKANRQDGNVKRYEAGVFVNPLMHTHQRIQHGSLTAVTRTNMPYEKGGSEHSFVSKKMPCFIKEGNSNFFYCCTVYFDIC